VQNSFIGIIPFHFSAKCWKGLVEVFNPRKKPWVDMNGADLQQIIEQVALCPSGALICEIADVKEEAGTQTEMNTSVEVLKNGPLMVYGNLKVKDSNGNESSRSKVTAFCRCGASANKPFCDGSHMRIGFSDE
jgi:uncharacterized Fe-S cluster protein YjdI